MAGNGSIIRLAPVVLYFAEENSRTTQGTGAAVEACENMARLIVGTLTGHERKELVRGEEGQIQLLRDAT